ncbi:hypothetical protein H0H92_006881 [Tricholoma furcatifolium]|nr:hypothetical protein H0H92_006881 [Tricholoma furcatifolium]
MSMSESSPTRQHQRLSRRNSVDLRQHALLSTTTAAAAAGTTTTSTPPTVTQEWHRNPVFAPPGSLLNSRRSSLASLSLSFADPDALELNRIQAKRRGSRAGIVDEYEYTKSPGPMPTEPASPEDGSNFRRNLQIDMKGLVGDAVGNTSRAVHYRPRSAAQGAPVPSSGRDVGRRRRAMEPSPLARRIHRVYVERETVSKPHNSIRDHKIQEPVQPTDRLTDNRRLIWNLLLVGKTSIEFILQAHYRAITDINWHTTECDTVISVGIDSWLWAWDLRTTRKPTFGLSPFKAGGTQVKWNRQDGNILASSHADEVLIWDRRKGSLPLKQIKAHSAKIYGIDWAHDRRDELITCSLDKTIKIWDTSTATGTPKATFASSAYAHASSSGRVRGGAGAAGDRDPEPRTTIHTAYPVWRARSLPFGRGLLSLAQRGTSGLEMYGEGRPDAPVERFEGHTDVVKEFVWRRGGEDEYQLITWSKDRTLRFWPVGPEVMQQVGHTPSPTKSRRSSRGGEHPNTSTISYRNPPEGTEYLPALSAPIGHRSILAEVRAPLPPLALALTAPPKKNARSGTMSRGGGGFGSGYGYGGTKSTSNNYKRGGGAVDPVTWLSNVTIKVGERERRGSSEGHGGGGLGLESVEGERRLGERLLEYQAEMNMHGDGEYERERGEGRRSESRVRGGGGGEREGEASQSQTQLLQDEITSVLKKLHPMKVNLEKHDLTKKRTCTIGLHGPWGGPTSVFIRVTFTFPREYPQAPHPLGTPTVDIERNPLISLKDRAFMLRRLAALREQRPCLEACLKFVLFRDEDWHREPWAGVGGAAGATATADGAGVESESSSSEDEDAPLLTVSRGRGGKRGGKGKNGSSTTIKTVKNLVEPRTSQGVFGPNGELVCFFRSPTHAVRNVLRGLGDGPSASAASGSSLSSGNSNGNTNANSNANGNGNGTGNARGASTPSASTDPAQATPRQFQAPALISEAVRRLNVSAKDRPSWPLNQAEKQLELRRPSAKYNIERVMTNLLTLQPNPAYARANGNGGAGGNGHGAGAGRGTDRRPLGDLLKSYALLAAPPLGTVFLSPTTNLAGADKKAARDYVFGSAESAGRFGNKSTSESEGTAGGVGAGAGGSGGLKELCAQNARMAKKHGRYDHERAFRMVEAFVPSSSQKPPHKIDALAAKVLADVYDDFAKNKDVQMLGMISVILLQTYDLLGASANLPIAPIYNSVVGDDYFSLVRPNPRTDRPTLWRRPSTPTVPQPQPGTSLASSTSSRGSWSSLFNAGSMRQFMSGVQDTFKEGLTTPLEAPPSNTNPTPLIPPTASTAAGNTARPRIQLPGQLENSRYSADVIRRQQRQGLLGSEPKSPVSPSKTWNETGSLQGSKIAPSLSSSATTRRTPLTQVSDPSNTTVEHRRMIVFQPPAEAEMERPVRLFTEPFLERLRLHVHAYADLLCRWQMFHKRLELLKAVKKQNMPVDESQTLTIGLVRTCPSCAIVLSDKARHCSSCPSFASMAKCSICRLPVKGELEILGLKLIKKLSTVFSCYTLILLE